jgi:hypothetical protein
VPLPGLRTMVTDTWPQPRERHPDRRHLDQSVTVRPARPACIPPGCVFILAEIETAEECILLHAEQQNAIALCLLRLEDAQQMPCECEHCLTLFDANETDDSEWGC